LLTEVLLFAVENFDFLIYPVFHRICCGLLACDFFAFDFDVDVVWFQMINFAHFIKPHCGICFQ
jgi:hypothetical protein